MGGHVSVESEEHIIEKLSEVKIKEEANKPTPKSKQRYLQSGKSSSSDVTVASHEVQDFKLAQVFSLDNWVKYKGKTPKAPHERPEIPEKVKLTVEQKALIRGSWEHFYKKGDDISKLADIGTKMFSHIFDLSPKVKGLFPYKEMYDEELTNDKTFRAHTTRFMATIAMAVKNLDDLDHKVAPAFVNLGKRHREFKGLDDNSSGNSFFGVFTGSMMFALDDQLGATSPKQTRAAWCRFLDYIVQHVQFGYNTTD